MKKKKSNIGVSVGCIKQIKRTDQNVVKYRVDFIDDAITHSVWSNWTSDRGLYENASVMVKYEYIPFTHKKRVRLLELDNLPQYFEHKDILYVSVFVGIFMGLSGFLLGKITNS